MILGIDFGISTTDVVLLNKCKLLKAFHIEGGSLHNLKKAISMHGIDAVNLEHIAITGGKAQMKELFGKKVSRVPELKAIAAGGAFLSKSKRCLVVSMGTGTCIVSFNYGKAKHVAGTALGGGTITGLSRLLAGEQDPSRLIKLASGGNPGKFDLSVMEAIGGSIGLAPANATASNFVKLAKASKSDLAAAVQNMVAESNAIIAALAAKVDNCGKIVFVGKACSFPLVKKRIKIVLSYYGLHADFPRRGKHATALGAALLQGNCFK